MLHLYCGGKFFMMGLQKFFVSFLHGVCHRTYYQSQTGEIICWHYELKRSTSISAMFDLIMLFRAADRCSCRSFEFHKENKKIVSIKNDIWLKYLLKTITKCLIWLSFYSLKRVFKGMMLCLHEWSMERNSS